jgi:hypothetical protein
MTETPKRRGRPPGQNKKQAQDNDPIARKARKLNESYADSLRRKADGALKFFSERILPILPQLAPSADLTHVTDAIRDLTASWPKVAAHKSFDSIARPPKARHQEELQVGMVVQLSGAGFIRAFHAFGERAARGPWVIDEIHGKYNVLSSKLVKGAKMSEGSKTITDNSSLAARRHDRLMIELTPPAAATPADNSLV